MKAYELTADELLTISTQANLALEKQRDKALDEAFDAVLCHCKKVAETGKTVVRLTPVSNVLTRDMIDALQVHATTYAAQMNARGFIVASSMPRGRPESWELVIDWTHPKK